jgi:GntR family transcriptional regulator/MocR family aminotransferase
MSPNGSTLGLAIDLPARGSRQMGRDLHQQLRGAIVGGRLHPGLRLPATRELAEALGVSRNTVVAAYDLLLSEGYVSARGRGGTIIADFLSVPPRRERIRSQTGRDARLTPAWRAVAPMTPAGTEPGRRFDFTVGIPDWESFPLQVWRRLAARALRSAPRMGGTYGEPEGRVALRQAIAGHISFARAIACTAEDIVVTAGAQQAFDLLARILITPGKTTVAVEDPGYQSLRCILAAAGARLVYVPVDGDGLKVDRLPRDTKVIFATPSHQYPLGARLSLARRTALLEFARAHDAVIVEDDYDGEFRYAGKPLDALQTLDRAQSVFYVGTFSKSMFPALRLGFVIAPPWARNALVAAKQLCDWHAPLVAQDILTAFIAEGHLARHVRKMSKIYSERSEILQNALERFCGEHLRVVGIGAGLHLAAHLTHSTSASALIERARDAGIWLSDWQQFATKARKTEGLIFGYGAIHSRNIPDAIRRLAKVMS